MDRLRLRLTGSLLRPHGKDAFVQSLPRGARLFDVGCGNQSPARVSVLRPDLHYIGLDVGDYNQSLASKTSADEYIVCTPNAFAASIRDYPDPVDAFLCAHNLEHCNDPEDVLDAMAGKLAADGRMYLAYPCAQSVRFPHRRGTLNFYDDPTHAAVVDTEKVLAILRSHRVELSFLRRRYRPVVPALIGLSLEPVSSALRRNIPLGATWALYGFETVIWGLKQ
jgi:2-polyprenyl-3-methyl-5-hydroxy-6-metoxy-1,4-benzoquinol methylase